ncbi:TonB-dependent receptor [Pseudokordiimonas caeni]|uniref:TonB-dependent receptor n=1 Tax=Pseudokordiimonas caeni TaxID=2997908 RepID=UPI0028115EA7|nr:TonB-dependent receptor [Pseudokordiimonas caeni]
MKTDFKKALLGAGSLLAFAVAAHAEETSTVGGAEDMAIDEIVISARKTTYANNATDAIMMDQKPAASSVLAVVDSLPGMFIAEGGPFGSDDWSTTVSVRGFTVSLSEQQVGMTIDGLPNGNSNYGGGAKANRYIDSENMERAEVSQGTADIASPSHEALGGTINFVTSDPLEEQRFWGSVSMGNNNAQRYFARYDTGEFAEGTRAYFSYSNTQNDAWIGNAGGTERDHFEAKIVSEMDQWKFTGRLSFDDVTEANYQQISLAEFEENPNWDRLTDEITGIPYIDQVYRPVWGTLRRNWFAYAKAEYRGDNFDFTVAPYYHDNWGRGDWAPPYIVAVTGGDVQSNGTIYGGSAAGSYTYVDANGTPLAPIAGCTATLPFPYGGSSPASNPACYEAGANPVSSYRHTHYGKKRYGVTADGAYRLGEMNTLRAGLWWENSDRHEYRDWHNIIDPRSSVQFDDVAYWRQYDRDFDVDTLMLYAEDTLELGRLQLRGGIKKYLVDLTRTDNFGTQAQQEIESDSDILFSAGALFAATDNLEVFAGFAQNFAAIKDGVIEGAASVTNPEIPDLEGETADNFDFGLRFGNGAVRATITAYYVKFNNRITFVSAGDPVDGVDYLEEGEGAYFNVGGIKSKGIEASISADFAEHWNIYGALTLNDSEYTETTAQVTEGNKVALAPEFQLVGTLSYYNDGVRAGVSAKHVGERYGNFANTEEVPSYTTVDAWVGYTMPEGTIQGIGEIDFSLNATNLTDKRYLGGGEPGAYFIGAERQITANIGFKF